jgi:hypothetical protein
VHRGHSAIGATGHGGDVLRERTDNRERVGGAADRRGAAEFTAEDVRKHAETMRAAAEVAYAAAESAREQMEQARQANEGLRKATEEVRQVAETLREQAEEQRASEEEQRHVLAEILATLRSGPRPASRVKHAT